MNPRALAVMALLDLSGYADDVLVDAMLALTHQMHEGRRPELRTQRDALRTEILRRMTS